MRADPEPDDEVSVSPRKGAVAARDPRRPESVRKLLEPIESLVEIALDQMVSELLELVLQCLPVDLDRGCRLADVASMAFQDLEKIIPLECLASLLIGQPPEFSRPGDALSFWLSGGHFCREVGKVEYILNNSFGMLGINSVVIVKKV